MSRSTARRDRLATVVAGALASALLVSCGGAGDPGASGPSPAAGPPTTVEYAPGLTEDLYLPKGRRRVPLVVLVPGGSWTTSDPTGLDGLAAALSNAGIAASPAHIRAAEDGVVYPQPVEDVLCAVAAAADHVRAHGGVPGPVVVLGHSSGAHLAALAALAPDPSPGCASPPVTPDALIGLSGPYDISLVPDVARALLGSSPAEDPETWREANPVQRADLRPEIPVLLLHGSADETVPVAFSSQFAEALQDGGHPTTVQLVPGADHESIYRADVSARRIIAWLLQLETRSRG